MVGIYEGSILIEKFSSNKKTSDILPKIFEQILEKYDIKRAFFANGPGSFMAIKVSYIFLKTLSIIKGIELFATDGFSFNDNAPIKAIGKKYFIKENGKIEAKFIEVDESLIEFKLPKLLESQKFTTNIEPLYILPAV